MKKEDKQLTPKQASEIVGCTPHHIRMLIRLDRLKGSVYPDPDRAGRLRYLIPMSEVWKLLKKFNPSRGFPRGSKRDGIRGPLVP